MNEDIVRFIRGAFATQEFIPLHAPIFRGNEKAYLAECIDSTYVSYVGSFVTKFEECVAKYTGARHAIAFVNGTLALHTALMLAGVQADESVLTQSLTFVATVNAIRYCGAQPIFIDSEEPSLGMSVERLGDFLDSQAEVRNDGACYDRKTGRKISACVPVHVFGHPCRIDRIVDLCRKKNITVVEDAAESLGSFYGSKHTGRFGAVGVLSFNGNKTITTGGGGMLLTDSDSFAQRARHLSTTAKVPHRWEFFHDEVGYNYRMPNVNAAIGCAQMEQLESFLQSKRELASDYRRFFKAKGIPFLDQPDEAISNFWLNAIFFENRQQRDAFLEYSNNAGVMTRPAWTLNHKLPMYGECQLIGGEVAQSAEDRLVNIPSSVRK